MNPILSSLNPQQRKAARCINGPSLILAGAGSGKTRVLTHRAAYLIDQGVSPRNILLITFTNKAANEMKERVFRLVDVHEKPHMGTFHATCARILRQQAAQVGLPPNYLIYDQADQLAVVRQAMKKLKLSPKEVNPAAVRGMIASAKCELLSPSDYSRLAYGPYQKKTAEIYPLYQEIMSENEALDFGDLLMKTVNLLKANPQVRRVYQDLFLFVMVDEYQDTNKAQYEFTKLVAGGRKNLCVVGDCSQSIYAFRGANLGNILRFKTDFPQARVFNLDQNYRSTQIILDAATEIIKPNKSVHPVLHLWTKNKKGSPIVVYRAIDEIDEALFVIYQIQKLRSVDLDEFAVLYRTNAQSRVLEEAFLQAKIPYRLIGGVHFYERREVKDIVAYLRYILNPKDLVSFKRIVNTPPRGIGPVTLKKGGDRLDKFISLIKQLRAEAHKRSVSDLLDYLLAEIKFKEYLDDGTREGFARWENVLELKSLAQSFLELPPWDSLVSFLENVALMEKTEVASFQNRNEVLPQKVPAVNLMTLHAAKGLEFTTVFIVGMEEGLLPHIQSMMEKEKLEEERRLAYVGITRAKERVFLVHTQSRLYFGQRRIFPPSRFLEDIPEKLVEVEGAGTASG
ncbi:hypothetical protein B5M47_01410 [candidate division CPR3 bacterium 4484_211]|uniref:DNA 3'-5' helicase n=1 Tax=candidate division CPR3 bacterium 4484_211 TaxID=1968527 RepID=A0A1W9NYG7_UNCC3|nr:MAG: hypothetical protein B5M47_01410 [candidate division CPR3 bacterium 4484_211]